MHKLRITHELLLETIQDGIRVIDAHSNITFVKPKMAEILGYEIEEMIGKHLFDFIDEEEMKSAEKEVERRKSKISETHESRLLHTEGHHVYFEIKTIPITDAEGNYNGAVAEVTDITDREQAEDGLKLQASERAAVFVTELFSPRIVIGVRRINRLMRNRCSRSLSGWFLFRSLGWRLVGEYLPGRWRGWPLRFVVRC